MFTTFQYKAIPVNIRLKDKRRFVKLLQRDGWHPYTNNDEFINLKRGNRLLSAKTLYKHYTETK